MKDFELTDTVLYIYRWSCLTWCRVLSWVSPPPPPPEFSHTPAALPWSWESGHCPPVLEYTAPSLRSCRMCLSPGTKQWELKKNNSHWAFKWYKLIKRFHRKANFTKGEATLSHSCFLYKSVWIFYFLTDPFPFNKYFQEIFSHLELRHSSEPERRVGLNLRGRNEDGVVTRVHGAETPEREAQATVGIQTQSNVSWRIEFTLELHCTTQSSGGAVGHLDTSQHTLQ